ncbi:8-amino-7-oxononanoate synthase [Sulfuritalea sp.]|uniref:aminotransferase class I/II-fold pyridoxal phosphate-dependent enzyme n=1 Tax=Sulfuritalea sp. TaxID=2480090 RepID=UPI001AD19B7D|nr:8-amino-7-oxononanoate synthase [Sulfuritalea sp.]MBN8475102.1 8-amino-7-oxononanoate synthase [Sulfuritalea sp.]
MKGSLDALLQQELAALDAGARRRRLRALVCDEGRLRDAQGRALIDVSSNDYLDLSQHPLIKQRAAEWALRHGAGAPASRLVAGTRDITLAVEQKLAAFKGREAALLFSSGFQANATVIPALARLGTRVPRGTQSAGAGDTANATTIFSDELNHASIIHGARAARCPVKVFRHNDIGHLDALLGRHDGRKLIVTESVFSMDGDRADLPALAALAERQGALLHVDEAHATGILGPQGRGLAAGVAGVDVVMGTLGKAFGAFGAYVAGSRALIDWLVNCCSGFIFTTALPPPVLGAVDAALDLVPGMDAERARVAAHAQRLREGLAALGISTLESTTQIVPAVIGAEADTLAAAARLDAAGFLAVAIRPPTVAPGSSRLRLAINSTLTTPDIDRLLAALSDL